MPQALKLSIAEFVTVRASAQTTWVFAEIRETGGASAVVEVTSGGDTRDAIRLIGEFMEALKGKKIASEADVESLLGIEAIRLYVHLPLATAVSAIRTAVIDIQSQYDGQSLTQALGGNETAKVLLYANINRSILGTGRTLDDFATAAQRAVADGFTIVKCAPFDEVHPPASVDEIVDRARPGLDRVSAVKSAIGPDVRLLVDCHARFEEHTAPVIARELAELGVDWFEEPVEPTTDAKPLARIAAAVGMPLAGGEHGYGEGFFRSLVEMRAVDVVMPDVKYCGGVAEARRAGMAAAAAGGQASLHNPSGPISQLASAHVTAAMRGEFPLEHPFGEADWRADLIEPAERIENGHIWMPGGTGLGATLNPALVSRHGGRWEG